MNTPYVQPRVLRANPQVGMVLGNTPTTSISTAAPPTINFDSPSVAGRDVAERTGFEAFYSDHYQTVVRSLSITLGDVTLGREAADEAMLRSYANWSKISGYDNPAGWSYRVGLNWARSWHRRSTRRLPFHTATSVELPATPDPALDQALMNLDVKYRAVVVCRYLLDWSTEQTAEALELRPGTVKSRLSTGLAHLRTALGVPEPSTAPAHTASAQTRAHEGQNR